MNKTLFNTLTIFTGLIVLYFIAVNLINEKKILIPEEFATSSTQALETYKTIYTSKGSVKALIADTDTLREQGLSDRATLPQGVGMLFIFDTPGKYGFWMKDMNFPIDLIWIDSDKKIVGVTENALPSSYPYMFMPPKNILYVLEMNTGSIENFGLKTGTSVKF